MTRFMKLLGLFLLVSFWSYSVRAANVTLMPVNVKLSSASDRATVQVVNNGQEPVLMQAEAIAWHRVGGLDIDAPTGDLIVNPPIFTVQPGQTQVLRLGLRRAQELAQEATYRIVLREVPMPRPSDVMNVAGSVRVLVAMRVPVYVAPAQVRRTEQWQVSRADNGDLIAQVANTGNVHLKVGELRVHGADDLPLAVQAARGAHAVIFPGERRSFRLPAAGQATQILVQTDEGLQRIALNDAGAAP